MTRPLILTLVSALLVSAVAVSAAPAAARSEKNFTAHLSGDQGQAIFHLSDDGTELHYKLIVANIENVVASHIHLAPAGQNGGIVVFLFGSVPPGGGRTNGVLAEGTITAANLINDLAGQPLSALIDEINDGNAYVNVHTNDGVDPANTGPGDFPGGEVRGQIPGAS